MKFISNKTLFNIHGWLGLNLGLLLFVICFSGTFATLSNEVDWLLNPDLRIEKKEQPFRWEAMYANLKKTFPEGRMRGMYEHKNSFTEVGDSFAAMAFMELPNGQIRKVHINPYSGAIQGHTSFFDVQRFFRTYHRRFFDGNQGIFIITLCAFFLLFSAITGFLFYKGWLKNLFKLRLKKGIKTFFSDAHKFFGIWSLVFALIISLTGIFYFIELMTQTTGTFDVLIPKEPAKIEKEELAQWGYNPELLSLDTYVQQAEQAFPGLRVETLRIPFQPNEYVYVDGQDGNPFTRDRANRVYLHPFTGEVVHIQKTSDLNIVELITDIVDPLHLGTFGGLPVKILWFIFGLALSFSILSGTYLWYIRGMQKMKRKLRRRGPPSKERSSAKKNSIIVSGFLSRHLTLSRGAVISTILILVYLITTGIDTVQDGIRSFGPLPKERFAVVEEMKLGPWKIGLQCEYPCTLEQGTSFFADFRTSGIPNYGALAINFISTENDTLSIPFTGAAQKPSIVVNEKVAQSEISQLQLSVQTLTGKTETHAVEMEKFSVMSKAMNKRFTQYPERGYPEVPFGVYAFISFFGLLVVSVLVAWTYFLVRATSKQRKIGTNK